MARIITHKFIIDMITPEKFEGLKKSLLSLKYIKDATYDVYKKIMIVSSKHKDIESEVKMACEINNCIFRIKI